MSPRASRTSYGVANRLDDVDGPTIEDVARAAGISRGAVWKLLTVDEQTAAGAGGLPRYGSADVEVVLPNGEDAVYDLLRLAVPHEDIGAIVACLPTLRRPGPLRWLLERCVGLLVGSMDRPDGGPRLPTLPNRGELVRYFYVCVFLAMVPHIRELHRRRGIPEEVTWLTLADLGRRVAVHRRFHGVGGLRESNWLVVPHVTGMLYQLGRLQFERTTLGKRFGPWIARAGLPDRAGDPCLSVGIPEYCGPLSPESCDESFAAAREFFVRHFPGEHYRIAVCASWLLDTQLAEYLPVDSNIVQFQRRFDIHTHPANDRTIVRFVFGRNETDLDRLSPRTTLERAIVEHLRAGRHWRAGTGWLAL